MGQGGRPVVGIAGMHVSRFIRMAWSAAAFFAAAVAPLNAETLHEALALAYSNNPTLNAQRAQTRSVDETVAIAKSGYRPVLSGSADIGKSWTRTSSPLGTTETNLHPGGFGVTISQTLFDGFKTQNNVSSAKAAVMASRETLRNVEQNVLFDAAAAYMDVIQFGAIARYRQETLAFLNELVRAENTRFEVGESTRTDVALAEGRRAAAQAQLSAARADLQTAIAVYEQLIGKKPGKLRMPSGVAKKLPHSIDAAFDLAYGVHPAVLATRHLVDKAMFDVKSAESDLLPTVTLDGTASRRVDVSPNTNRDSASVTATLRVPIYQGGRVSAQIRQNKEVLGQRRIEVDQTVDQVRAAVASAYSQYQSATASVTANQAQLRAARLALQGASEERKVGQRTTLEVLDTQQDVLEAQIALAAAERNAVVATYAALSAIGRLNASELGLNVARYDAEDHYLLVKDKWYGLRTPDGR